MFRILLLSGIIIGAFLFLVLLRKPNKTAADYLLMIWFWASGHMTFSYYLVETSLYLQYPSLTVTGLCLPLLAGPVMYLYIKYQTQPLLFRKLDLLHSAPFLFCFILFASFYFEPFEKRIEILNGNIQAYDLFNQIKVISIYLSGIIYIFLSFKTLMAFRAELKHAFSNIEKINFNWLLTQITGLSIVWILVLFVRSDNFIFGAVAVLIIWIGYFGITQVNVFSSSQILFSSALENKDIKISNSSAEAGNIKNVDDSNQALIPVYEQAFALLKNERLYLNPDLKLLDLAIRLDIHPNLLSKALNEVSGKSFYDLVNEQRVQAFIRKLERKENNRFTLIALAYDCGFNSKASFNRNFKQITGMTPSDYLEVEKGEGRREE